MEEYVKQLKAQLETEFNKINLEGNAAKGYGQCAKLVKDCIDALKSYLVKHPFKDLAAEVYYFKQVAPIFYPLFFYVTKLYYVELVRITSTKEAFLSFLDKEEKAIEDFYDKYGDFCRYYYMGVTFLDAQFFTRGAPENWIPDEAALLIDDNFSLASYRLAWIKANEEYRRFLENEKIRLENRQAAEDARRKERKYTWEGQNADAAELIYVFKGKKLVKVNGRDADLKDLTIMFKDFFEKEIRNVYDTHRHNMKRKK